MRSKGKDKELYFIALVPEEPVYSEIWHLKEEMRDRFETKAALRSPPHITLHMPFKWSANKEEALFNSMQAAADNTLRFYLSLKDFGAFEPRVIYVNVIDNEQLTALQKDVGKRAAQEWHIYQQPDSRPFQPHMTIAFRDLKKPKFHEAWQEFSQRKYENEILITSLALLKHNGRTWDIYKSFNLQSDAD